MKIHQAWEIKSRKLTSDSKFTDKEKSEKSRDMENSKTEKTQEIRY